MHKVGSALLAGTWPWRPPKRGAASPFAVREAPGPYPEATFHTGERACIKGNTIPPPTFYTDIFNFQHSQLTFLHLLCLNALAAPGNTSWKTFLPHILRGLKSPVDPLFATPHVPIQLLSLTSSHAPLACYPSPKPFCSFAFLSTPAWFSHPCPLCQ